MFSGNWYLRVFTTCMSKYAMLKLPPGFLRKKLTCIIMIFLFTDFQKLLANAWGEYSHFLFPKIKTENMN